MREQVRHDIDEARELGGTSVILSIVLASALFVIHILIG